MNFQSLTIAAALTLAGAAGHAADMPAPAPAKPIRVILVGDSTMAPHNGYGDALCARFTMEVTCVCLT
jgi:hypothetical protein